MRAILTVIGQDQIGIVANTSKKLAELSVNILDISQTIMGKNFTMMMMVDLSQSKENFEVIHQQLHSIGESMNLTIKIQLEEIFDAMHKL